MSSGFSPNYMSSGFTPDDMSSGLSPDDVSSRFSSDDMTFGSLHGNNKRLRLRIDLSTDPDEIFSCTPLTFELTYLWQALDCSTKLRSIHDLCWKVQSSNLD